MINFEKENDLILFAYVPDRGTNYWVVEKLKKVGSVTFNKTYNFNTSELHNKLPLEEIDEFEPIVFVFAQLNGDYYKIYDGILSLDISVYFHKDLNLHSSYFVAIKNISIFRKIGKLVKNDIYIGGKNDNAIPFNDFEILIKRFPNSYEIEKYAQARISSIINNYFVLSVDGEINYKRYMNNKVSKRGVNLLTTFKDL